MVSKDQSLELINKELCTIKHILCDIMMKVDGASTHVDMRYMFDTMRQLVESTLEQSQLISQLVSVITESASDEPNNDPQWDNLWRNN
jgi:hypothetical protein